MGVNEKDMTKQLKNIDKSNVIPQGMTLKKYDTLKNIIPDILEGIKSGTVKISKGNTKTGAVPSVSTLPEFTCNKQATCFKKGCYAKNLCRYTNVLKAYTYNAMLWFHNPQQFERSIIGQIPIIGMFRWHISGDIVSKEYFEMMCRIAVQFPNTSFMAFTKKFDIVNTWISENGKLPVNLNIVFSHWKNESFPNIHNLPSAYVRYKNSDNEHLPEKIFECPSNCAKCGICWNLQEGEAVVFNQH